MSGNARPGLVRKRIRGDFWDHVAKSGGCWLWTGAKNGDGYGNYGRGGRTRKASRVAWELAHGPIPDGLWVLHHCDNPPCVKTEPDERWPEGHLFLGTCSDNHKDAVAKGRWNSPQRLAGYKATALKLAGRPGLLGEANGNAKLTKSDVDAIRSRYASGLESQSRIAFDYGITQVRVSQLVRGVAWRE